MITISIGRRRQNLSDVRLKTCAVSSVFKSGVYVVNCLWEYLFINRMKDKLFSDASGGRQKILMCLAAHSQYFSPVEFTRWVIFAR